MALAGRNFYWYTVTRSRLTDRQGDRLDNTPSCIPLSLYAADTSFIYWYPGDISSRCGADLNAQQRRICLQNRRGSLLLYSRHRETPGMVNCRYVPWVADIRSGLKCILPATSDMIPRRHYVYGSVSMSFLLPCNEVPVRAQKQLTNPRGPHRDVNCELQRYVH